MKIYTFHKALYKKVPSDTGVYFFLKNNTPLYIGKAVNLKARIVSHIRNSVLDSKEALIVNQADHIQVIVTQSEFNALLLEAQLIKRHTPKYNVIWKDGKTHLYIKITQKEQYPKIFSVRAEDDGKSLYVGPFYSSSMAHQLLRETRKIIPFCTQKKITHPKCFYSKIGLCDPCPNMINQEKDSRTKKKLQRRYRAQIRKIILILKGKSDIVMHALIKTMNHYSKKNEYEKALRIRNNITALRQLITERSFHESMTTGLMGFRIDELLEEFNAFMARYFNRKKIYKIFMIECFDVSHLFGSHATASMVVFQNGLPVKKLYKRFKVKTVYHASDKDMMKEIIIRRLKRTEWKLPDFIIVDGGRPQLAAVSTAIISQKLDIPCIGFAKNPDRVVAGYPAQTIYFFSHSVLLLLFKYIRDESHRFAKKYHTHLRNKNLF